MFSGLKMNSVFVRKSAQPRICQKMHGNEQHRYSAICSEMIHLERKELGLRAVSSARYDERSTL